MNRAAPMPHVRLLESDDPARLTALREEWSALFDAAGAPNPFLSSEWGLTSWRLFARRRPLWLLEARDDGDRLCGLLALTGRASMGGRRYGFLGAGAGGAAIQGQCPPHGDGLETWRQAGSGAPGGGLAETRG